ncbi:MAG: hypothetical protein UT66_C0001G0001 [candidate division CPR2 bacterium GW2011_GWC1_39_9]|uniref:Uncharacterized protein n=1 Tax=candidate division CPR2 bacterium GW2011_GWC2_39_10 TaxID=1618345 RepID=A0A0G0Q170_UNCC2|nr:MAG: hypothetical protein UT18_C0001G0003 [candidate division CPR2 bacterium GW2011_GWC2_39_10]KKR36177.1 MAG: hypothetical protein UT66_C0001G0001 [candidate division CPR2 bacterium GW2011_GWC1_39_9]
MIPKNENQGEDLNFELVFPLVKGLLKLLYYECNIKFRSFMEEQNSIKNGTPVWIWIILIILVVGFGVGGTWYVMDQKVKNSDSKITSLQNQVDTLRKKATTTPTPTTTTIPTTTPTTTTDITANWKTYSGTILGGYSIKYPSSWSAEEANKGINTESVILRRTSNTGADGDYWVDIAQFYGDASTFASVGYGTDITNTTIAGFSAKKANRGASIQSPAQTHYLISHGGKNYLLGILYINASDAVGDQILNTFKFNS